MSEQRLYELRTYDAHPGKLDALVARFRDHTVRLFDKHQIELVGFWVVDASSGGASDRLVYLVSFSDRGSADTAWKAFLADPEWVRVREESERDGPLTATIESTFLAPTDFSPMR